MKYRLLLLLASLLWGATLVAQRVSTELLGPFTFMASRYLLGSLSLLPILYLTRRYHHRNQSAGKPPFPLPVGAAILAILLTAGTGFQQMGIFYTTAGKAGFITCLYIVVVPFLGIPFGKPLRKQALIGCLLAVAGLYFLAYPEGGGELNRGDVLIFICSLVWAVDILMVDRWSPYYDGFTLVTWEFFFAFLYNTAIAFLMGENVTLEALKACILPIVYCGFFGGGLAYSLQFIGQRGVSPTEASLLLSSETIFSALSGWLFLNEIMSGRELMGCFLMGLGILMAQLDPKSMVPRKKETT
jgi:drug/metabolite transporter (DMT)-like permease